MNNIYFWVLFIGALALVSGQDGMDSVKQQFAMKYAHRGVHDCVLADTYLAAALKPLICIFLPHHELKSSETGPVLENLLGHTEGACDWALVMHDTPNNRQVTKTLETKLIGTTKWSEKWFGAEQEIDALIEGLLPPYRRAAIFRGKVLFRAPLVSKELQRALECAFWPQSSPLVHHLADSETVPVVASTPRGVVAVEFVGPTYVDGTIFDACYLNWLVGPIAQLSNVSVAFDYLNSDEHTSPETVTNLCHLANVFWLFNFRGAVKTPFKHPDCALLVQPVKTPFTFHVNGTFRFVEKGKMPRSCRPLNANKRIPLLDVSIKSDNIGRVARNHGDIADVFVLYFPQFHRDARNDALWGLNYSDWTGLRQAPKMNRLNRLILRPLEGAEGNGEYDLLSQETRRRQGKMAKHYGVNGFIFHHYWFNHKSYNESGVYLDESLNIFNMTRLEFMNAPLSAPLMAMLQDGEPDVPFVLNWANSDWTATWQGKSERVSGEMIFEQKYPAATDEVVTAHYRYLAKFFRNKNYYSVGGKPVLFVYTDELPAEKRAALLEILRRFRELAKEDGFPGLHIPRRRHNTDHETSVQRWYGSKTKFMPDSQADRSRNTDGFDADVYYPGRHMHENSALPMTCMSGQRLSKQMRSEYIGVVSVFDNTPRRAFHAAKVWDRRWDNPDTAKSFETDMFVALMYERCCQRPRIKNEGARMVIVNAWNEWGEGMALEPSNRYKYTLLEAVKSAKERAAAMKCF